LESFIEQKENLAGNTLDQQFFKLLMDQIKYTQELPLVGKMYLKIARKQADPMMVHLLISGIAEAIMSSDSYFAVYAGDKCLCIKDFDYSTKETTIDKIVLSSGDKDYGDYIISCLHAADNATTQVFHKPDFPVFSNKHDPLFHALIAVGMGCNLNPGGMTSFGPSTMYKLLIKINKGQPTLEERFD